MKINWTHLTRTIVCALGLAAVSAEAAAPATPEGLITGRAFEDITGTAIPSLTNNAKFPDNPDAMFFFPYFEWNATGDIFTVPGDYSDNYGGQIVGYFYPPSTGDYYFYLAADDNALLFLSTDSNPANKKLIAQETAWSGVRSYLSSGGNSDLLAKDSSTFAGTEWPNAVPGSGAIITLQANQPYYIEAIFKEGTGGDNLSVAVFDPLGAIDPSAPIPGEYLSSDRTAGPVVITRQPQSQTVPERGSVTFSVLADGTPPYSYQWRRNGTDLTDETNLTFTVSSATVADNNAQFSVVVTGGQGSATSQNATLTVTPDTTVPTIVNAKGSPGLTEVTLAFSEPLDPVAGATASNYQISSAGGPLNVTGATVSPSGTTVTLTTAQQTLGTKYTIVVNGLRDTAATPNTIAADSRVVFFPPGAVREIDGFIVVEAENFDRNLDGLWVRDTTRGTPSGGASMVNLNGAGGSETSTKIEYDVEFASAGTYYVWVRGSGDNGNDDSVWFHIDGDGDNITERPFERDPASGAGANSASMSGYQPQADFVWRSDSQDGPDPYTVEVPAPGPRAIALARREDGTFVDKILLTTDSAYTPTGAGPIETREGAPGLPTVTLTAPATPQTITAGGSLNLSATAAGQSGLLITRVEFTANDEVIGEATTNPYTFTWNNVPVGIYGVQAVAIDEIGQTVSSPSVVVTVEEAGPKTSANIAWVSFHPADDQPSTAAATAGFTNAADVAYTDLLRANGHNVTRIVTSGNPDTAVLNAYDLVIISRSVPSGDYQQTNETAAWNGITAPMMLLGGYGLRDSRLGFYFGANIPDTAGPIKLAVTDTNHAIFEGIAFDASNTMVNDYADIVTFYGNGTVQRGISVITDPPVDGATVLATVGTAADTTFGGTIIAEFPAGTTLNNTAADTPDVLAGKRLVFLTGSRENDGLTSEGAGIFDLAEDGAKMFMNAVHYMAGVEGGGPGPEPTLTLARGAGGAITLDYTGTLESSASLTGGWAPVAGASNPHTVTPNEPMRFYRARN